MFDLKINIDQKEIDKRSLLLEDCAALQNSRIPVINFVDSPFYCKLAGIDLDEIYKSPDAMIRAQLLGFKAIVEAIDNDNYAPTVGIDFGSVRTATAYGCELIEEPHGMPQYLPWLNTEEDISRLKTIDPTQTGLNCTELDFYHKLKAMENDYSYHFANGEKIFPLKKLELNTASDGPFSIACMIAGMDNVCMWVYDHPELLKRLLDILTQKEIFRIKTNNKIMKKPDGPIWLADDYSPYVAVELYEEFILPYQLQLRNAFGNSFCFHSCIPDAKLLNYWRDQLNISIFNGPKPQNGLANLKRDYMPVAECMGGKIVMEPDIDGINTLVANREELKQAVIDFYEVFGKYPGVKLCATLSGGHDVGDLDKMNVIKQTVLELTK